MSTNTAAAILGRVIEPERPTLNPEAARSILGLSFRPEGQERVDHLLTKNGEGVLTEDEREELEEYLRANDLLSLLKSKARLSLKVSGESAGVS